MVIFLFHETNLFLVLYLSPWKLTISKLHQHVKQRPQIIVTALIKTRFNNSLHLTIKMFNFLPTITQYSPISLFL